MTLDRAFATRTHIPLLFLSTFDCPADSKQDAVLREEAPVRYRQMEFHPTFSCYTRRPIC